MNPAKLFPPLERIPDASPRRVAGSCSGPHRTRRAPGLWPTTFLLLGAVLLYWGSRSWMRSEAQGESLIRARRPEAVSLSLLGGCGLAIPLAPGGLHSVAPDLSRCRRDLS